jgi:hypothetical protein
MIIVESWCLNGTVRRSFSHIGLIRIYKMVYLLTAETQHHENFGVVVNIFRDTTAVVYRNMNRGVVAISSSTVQKQLLTVRP